MRARSGGSARRLHPVSVPPPRLLRKLSRALVSHGLRHLLGIFGHLVRFCSRFPRHRLLLLGEQTVEALGRRGEHFHTCDIVTVVGGRTGTLGEFAIVYDEGRLVGVLCDTGGITEVIEHLLEVTGKQTGARVLYESDPVCLVARLLEVYRTAHQRQPSCFCDETVGQR